METKKIEDLILPDKKLIVPDKKIDLKIVGLDAIGTTVALYDPETVLKSDEEKSMFWLSSPGKFSSSAFEKIFEIAEKFGVKNELQKLLDEHKNLPEKQRFYIVSDKLATLICKKNGDFEEKWRVDICRKIYHLVDPEIFPYVMDYIKKNYPNKYKVLMLTQGDPIMQEVFKLMLADYDVDIVVAPDIRFKQLYKDNDKLYPLVAEYFETQTRNMGLLDDSTKNIDAAKSAGVVTELYTQENIRMSAEKLINKLFGDSETKQM